MFYISAPSGKAACTDVPALHATHSCGAPPRRKLVAGLAAAVVVAGFLAVLATRDSGPSIAATPVPHRTATTAPQATDTASATPAATRLPAPSAFACANPAGSQMVYAYIRGDGKLYMVQGCSTPKQIAVSALYPLPLAWSPSNSYLMIDEQVLQSTDYQERVVAVNVGTDQIYTTGFSLDYDQNLTSGDTAHIFFGWLDDKTFLGVNVPITSGLASGQPIGLMMLVEVDLFSGTQRAITKITWAANFAVCNGRYVFYSGYQNASEGGAYLHRIDLETGRIRSWCRLALPAPDHARAHRSVHRQRHAT